MREVEMGSILLIVGIGLLVGGIGNGSFPMGVGGVVLIIVGAVLFWKTSATKAYLDQQKRR